ncbi:hypothetical protein LCGC14_2466970 [marine sediment metagenome]|uniref:Uncharacterized protein n=1 Tax=marine sediment metagenome TaxID=412755 RepID=A0A0F9BZA1_9ZZZZ
MVTSFREVFITFALIGVFVFAGISFIVTTQRDNGVTNTILDNDVINRTYSNLETDLGGLSSNASTQKESFESEIPERGFGSLLIFAIVGIGRKFTGMIIGIYNIIIVLPASLLGIPSIVISVMTAILLVSLVLLAWRVYRVGS